MAHSDGAIVFISESRVRPGQADALRAFLDHGSKQLAIAKPQTLGFLEYLDESATTLTVVHVFADAAGFDAHVGGAESRSEAASAFIETVALTIYGTPAASTLDAIASSTPADVPVIVQGDYVSGFLRA